MQSLDSELKNMAPGKVAGLNLPEFGTLFPAFVGGVGAAGTEPAALGYIHGAGQLSLNGNPLSLAAQFGIRNGNGRNQSLGVRMQRIFKDLFTGAQFHHAA